MSSFQSSLRIRTALAAAAALSVSTAGAADVLVHATQEPQPISSFTLDFGLFGQSGAQITQTEFDIVVDAVGETARFTSYNQQVQPLLLPGGISTGDITVEIVNGTSNGAFSRGATTGRFRTSELYRIHFTGDLSLYGLTSPVDLPGSSNGELAFALGAGGAPGDAKLVWDGQTQLPNPFDPQNPINLIYSCEVHADFAAEAAVTPHDGDMNCDGVLDFFDIDPFLLAMFDPTTYGSTFPACDVVKADVNDNTNVDFGDIDPFLDLMFD